MTNYDLHAMTMGDDVGINIDAPPASESPVIKIDTLVQSPTTRSTLLEQCTS